MRNHLCSLLGFFVSKKKSSQLNQCSQLPEDLCRKFSLAEIKDATNNFNTDSIIGRGGFGTVYKGTIDDGTIVAVKRWKSGSLQGVREFQNEIRFLCQLRHPHIISLIGFCEEQNGMILVYEYMCRGDLSDHLYGKTHAPLPWKQRLQICINAARGLHYLHTGAKYALIHGDIKSRNILINEELSCKLHDFGFSKLGSFCMSKATKFRKESIIMSSRGYMAPEYIRGEELTVKNDVFSFGVVLFEVLFGREAIDSSLPENQTYILDWAKKSLREGTIYDAIDPYLKGWISPECLNKYLEICSSCVHIRGKERPAMGEVEVTLELALEMQERSDSELEAINPSAECMYEEALFSGFVRDFLGVDGYYFSEFAYDLSYSDSNNSNNNDEISSNYNEESVMEELMLLEQRDS